MNHCDEQPFRLTLGEAHETVYINVSTWTHEQPLTLNVDNNHPVPVEGATVTMYGRNVVITGMERVEGVEINKTSVTINIVPAQRDQGVVLAFRTRAMHAIEARTATASAVKQPSTLIIDDPITAEANRLGIPREHVAERDRYDRPTYDGH